MTDKKDFNTESEKNEISEVENQTDKNKHSEEVSETGSESIEDTREEKDEKHSEEENVLQTESEKEDEIGTETPVDSSEVTEETMSDNEEEQDQEDAEDTEEDLPDLSTKTREEILNELGQLIEQYPEKEIHKAVNYIIELFEKKTAEHKANLLQKREAERRESIENGEELPEQDDLPEDQLPEKLNQLLKDYSQKQKAKKQSEKEQREKNLEIKKQIIANIDGLINKPESFGKTFNEFKEFQKQWDETGDVAKNENRHIWTEYNRAIEGFYNYVQINKELRDLDLQKNTEIKTALCEEAEALTQLDDIMEAQRRLQKLHDRWRETGPVVKELKDELWERFKKPTSEINEKHQERLQLIKEQQDKNLESKTYLCEKAEEAMNGEYKSNADWKKASALVQKYQKLWNSIGYVPKQYNQSIYERFSAACDGFFDRMRNHFESVNEERTENLAKKQALLEKARERMESTDWAKDTKFYKSIQNEWKKIGPVPRKHSDKIWKQFRSACNTFFDRKREHFSQRKEDEKANLQQKEELIQEIKTFKTGDKESATESIKEFQKRWQAIGYVPIKEKDRIISDYNAALDKLFENLGIDKSKKVSLKFNEKIQALENADDDRIWSEIGKLRSRIDEKEKEIKLWKNNLGFFADNKGSEVMKSEYQKRIERGEKEIAELKAMIDKLENL